MKTIDAIYKALGGNIRASLIAVRIENNINTLTRRFTANAYNGGSWSDLEIGPGLFVMVPDTVECDRGEVKVTSTNGNVEWVNRETLGAIVTTFAINWAIGDLFQQIDTDELTEMYYNIMDAARSNPLIDAKKFNRICD